MWHSHGASASGGHRVSSAHDHEVDHPMPTYEYACAKCGEHPEVYQTFSEAPLTRHNQCDGSKCTGKLQKVFSPVGIVLKGSGFYKTDSRNASRAASKASESKAGVGLEVRHQDRVEVGHQDVGQLLGLELVRARRAPRRKPPSRRRSPPDPRPAGPLFPLTSPHSRSTPERGQPCFAAPRARPALGRRRNRRGGHRRLRRRRPRLAPPPGPGLRSGPCGRRRRPVTSRWVAASGPRTWPIGRCAARPSRPAR